MNTLPDLISPVLHAALANGLKTTLLASAVLVLCLLPRRWLSSAWRHGLWCVVFVRLVLPDISISGWPWNVNRHLPVPPIVAEASVQAVAMHNPASGAGTAGAFQEPAREFVAPVIARERQPVEATRLPVLESSDTRETPALSSTSLSWWEMLGIVWLVGTLAWVVSLGWGWRRFRHRVLGRSTDAPARLQAMLASCLQETGVRTPVKVRCSEHLAMPAVYGILRPVVLLPSAVEATLPAHELRLLLLHEIGHVKRHDTLVQVVASLLLGLHWWNPALWLAWIRLRHEAEAATDAWVLRHTGADIAPSYGAMLLDLASRACTSGIALLLVPHLIGATSQGRHLKQRLLAIVGHQPARRWAGLSGMTLLLMLAMAGFAQEAARKDAEVKPVATAPDAIGGLVVDEQGKPIAGAQVAIELAPVRGRFVKSALPPDYKTPLPVQTDTAGRWEIRGVPAGVVPATSWSPTTLSKDVYRFFVGHPEFQHREFGSIAEPLTIEDASFRERTAKLVLKRGLVLRGVVKDEEGKPIAGATVERSPSAEPHAAPRATTDGSGRYELKSARPGDHTVRVRAKGFAAHLQRVKMDADAAQDFTLKKAQVLTVKVRDENGRPVIAYRDQRRSIPLVTLYPPGEKWQWGDRLWWSEGASEDGTVICDEAPAGELVAEIEGRGYARIKRKVTAGGEVVIKLGADDRLPKVTFKVTDADTGEPLTGCTFATGTLVSNARDWSSAMWLDPRIEMNVKADSAAGEYKGSLRRDRMSMRHVFCVRRAGYVPVITKPLESGPGDQVVSVALRKDLPLEITVQDAQGAAATDAQVYVIWQSSLSLHNFKLPVRATGSNELDFFGATDAKGRCVLPPAAEDAVVLVTHESGYATAVWADLRKNKTINLGLYAQVEAIVKQNGKPVPGGKFEYWGSSELSGGQRVSLMIDATPDAEGRISLPRVFPCGAARFKEAWSGPRPTKGVVYNSSDRGFQPVTVGKTTVFEIEPIASRLRRLTGRLVVEGGGVASVPRSSRLTVLLCRPSPLGYSRSVGFCEVDDQGRFEFHGVAPGNYTLEFQKVGDMPPYFAFSGGKQTLDVSFPEPAADAAGKPLELGDVLLVPHQK